MANASNLNLNQYTNQSYLLMAGGGAVAVLGAAVVLKASVVAGVALVCIGAAAFVYGYVNLPTKPLDPNRVSPISQPPSANSASRPGAPLPVATAAPLSSAKVASAASAPLGASERVDGSKDTKSEPKTKQAAPAALSPEVLSSLPAEAVAGLQALQAKFPHVKPQLLLNLYLAHISNISQALEKYKAAKDNPNNTKITMFGSDINAFPTLEQIVKELVADDKNKGPLTFTHAIADDIGKRTEMQDASFYLDTPEWVFFGVFDGNNPSGKAVATFARDQFKKLFPQNLQKASGDFEKAATETIDFVHAEVGKNSTWNDGGTTMVLTGINKEKQESYTATIADSETSVYRSISGQVFSFPLSLTQNWHTPKDEERLRNYALSKCKAKSFDDERFKKHWEDTYGNKGKERRVDGIGINIGRCIGNHGLILNGVPLSQDPEITFFPVKKGDTFTTVCDGSKDFVPEADAAEMSSQIPADFAQQLVDTSVLYQSQDHSDNVTAIVVKVS
jgi:serine/threonine protein phosphatase PrpC